MPARHLLEAWAVLVALSFGTVLLTMMDQRGIGRLIAVAGVLLLAALKMRVILARYLGLSGTRFWTRAFDLAIGLFFVLAFALHTFGYEG